MEYKDNYIKLCHDNESYNTLFAQIFGKYDCSEHIVTNKSELRRKSKEFQGKIIEESNSEQFQISYTIDHILTSCDIATHRIEMLKLLNGLSTT